MQKRHFYEHKHVYFQDIVRTGRGIILSHDIYYKAGRGNTFEMLKIH